jgi:hypothetical protein
MGTISLKSTHDGTTLEFCEAQRSNKGELEYFTVAIEGPNVKAVARVFAYMAQSLAAYLEDLSTSWPGWTKPKTWDSLEGECHLKATSDKLGHIFLEFVLCSGGTDRDWTVTGSLELEVGQLERAAAQAKEFFYMTLTEI